MMKKELKHIILQLFPVFFFLLISCSEQPSTNNDKKLIASTIAPIEYIAQKIGGNKFSYKSIIKETHSLHDFEPTFNDLLTLNKATCYFTIDLPLEEIIVKKVFNKTPEKCFAVTKDVQLLQGSSCQASHHDNHNHNKIINDIHIWLSPQNIKIMAKNIAKKLTTIMPENEKIFQINLTTFITEIDKIDKINRQMLKNHQGKKIIVVHSAYGYFLHEYGIDQISIEDATNHITPSALIEVKKLINETNLHIIYTQPQFSKRNAQAISKATNCEIITLNPLKKDLLANLKYLGESFYKNFENKEEINEKKTQK
ncbi:zinc ABC transporter substrate-binding protein [Lentisphaerota bacterium WC36G]|nr:zinc ABC transporter substrate-binding protein [Lentisphaerae bacterium WC36]